MVFLILGRIFDIQRFALHDGPGIRTTVFFQGCNCNCSWCHNPESQHFQGSLEYYPSRCIDCGRCREVCPYDALQRDEEGKLVARERCLPCTFCSEICYAGALVQKSRTVTVSEVMQPVLADLVYYEESGGGVTLSGGEPLLQSAFALDLLQACKERGLHTVIQTAGNYPYETLQPLLNYTDMIMYDLKAMNPQIYDDFIPGADRELILANLVLLGQEHDLELVVRTPCIGGVNDSCGEVMAIATWLQQVGNLKYYQLIPYHGLAKAKYDALGKVFASDFYTPACQRRA